MMSQLSYVHVKWFSEFSFRDRPLGLAEAITPTFLALALLSTLTIGGLVFLDRALAGVASYQRINQWLQSRSDDSVLVMRIAAGAVLLLSWQADALLVPELGIGAAWIGWYQFLLALLLLFRRTVPVAGAGLILLYAIGLARFGAFHMLDYLLYAGAGYYLLVSNARDPRVRGTGIPALFLTVGFSLCWVALEKIVYPQWGLYVPKNSSPSVRDPSSHVCTHSSGTRSCNGARTWSYRNAHTHAPWGFPAAPAWAAEPARVGARANEAGLPSRG